MSDSIEQLKNLRLLHFSCTKIEELSESITELYNLQTLRIEKCQSLKEFPKDFSNLIKLRHINIDCLNYFCPENVGRLTWFQTLPIFVVGPYEGYQIKEMGPLKDLRGEISIYKLGMVKDEEEAKRAKLKENEIFKLGLYWSCYDREKDMHYDKDEKVSEGLQPHLNLKSLTIECYHGKKFPSWVGLSPYHNLIKIYLNRCTKCEEVPTLGHLPYLRVLEIELMGKVRSIGSEFYSYSDGSDRNTAPLFLALRILKLKDLYELEEWKDAKEYLLGDTC